MPTASRRRRFVAMNPFEIHDAEHPFGKCSDRRPWLIVDRRENETYGCFPIASQHYDDHHFSLNREHPNFAATGLSKSCFVLDERIFEIPAGCFQRHRGRLTGDLLADFCKYADLSPS